MDIHAELARLEAAANDAEAKWRGAKIAMDRAVAGAIDHPAVVTLREQEDAKIFKKPGFDPARQRELVTALCRAIIEDPDLTLTSIGASRFRVDDQGPVRREREARALRDEAAQARDDFKLAHAAEFEADHVAAERAAMREALESGDRDMIRDALGVEQPRVALTTEDFFRPSGRN